MNCANHPDRERTAFCQSCGKPLCPECTRNLAGSIFCEPCYELRTAAVPPGIYPPIPPQGPSLAAAVVLGFIPGVGAMYNGQYAKGIVHLMVFALLVSLADQNGIFGLFVAGWICYMVIEAHHTARARRDGTPLPNPFGLNDLSERLGFGKAWPSTVPAGSPFVPPVQPTAAYSQSTGSPAGATPPDTAAGYTTTPPYGYPPYSNVPPPTGWGAPQDTWQQPYPPADAMPPIPDPNLPLQRRVPAGAIWLIGLGVLFLLGNTGLFFIRVRYVGPMLLIALGVWIFVRRMTAQGFSFENDGTPAYAARLTGAISASIWLVGTGFIWLLDAVHVLSWSRSWPLFLILAGVLAVVRRAIPSAPQMPPPGYGYPPYPGTPAPPAPVEPAPMTAIVPSPERHISEEGR